MSQSVKKSKTVAPLPRAYPGLASGITELLKVAGRVNARSVNALLMGTLMR
jgi:hypothetical protein